MRKTSIILFAILILAGLLAPVSYAQTESMPGMEGMQMDQQSSKPSDQPPPIPAGRGSGEHPQPVEQPADNSVMAAIAATVFALPVVIWFFYYFSRKPRRQKKQAK